MRLLFVAPRFHTNQVPLVRVLQEHGHEVMFHVLNIQPSEDHTLVEPDRVVPARLSAWLNRTLNRGDLPEVGARYLFPPPLDYLRRVREAKPDVLVIKHPSLPISMLAALAGRLRSVRIIFYTQGPVHAPPARTRDNGRELLMKLFNASWISPVRGDDRYPKLHPDMHYLPFIAAPAPERERTGSGREGTRLLSVGKFYPRKNHLLLLEAVDRLRRSHRLSLTLVGECRTDEQSEHHREVLEDIRRRGLEEVVEVRTNVPFPCMPALYRSHDLFVLPSRNEPAGVSILEAMAEGLPVVCSTTNGTSCYVSQGVNGDVFESDDADDLTGKLGSMLDDAEGLGRMGEASRDLVERFHSPDVVYRALMDIIVGKGTGES